MFIKPVERVLPFFHLNDEQPTFRINWKKHKGKSKKVVTNTTITLYGRNGMIAKWVIR